MSSTCLYHFLRFLATIANDDDMPKTATAKPTPASPVLGGQCQQLKRYWHLPRIRNQIEYLGQNTLR